MVFRQALYLSFKKSLQPIPVHRQAIAISDFSVARLLCADYEASVLFRNDGAGGFPGMKIVILVFTVPAHRAEGTMRRDSRLRREGLWAITNYGP